MSTHGQVQAVNINDVKQFSAEARVNLPLIKSKDLVTRINCYEPVRSRPRTCIPTRRDEIVFCVEGRGADFAGRVCELVRTGKCERGILICGTGIGMSIAANRYREIRAALCHEGFTAPDEQRA